MFIPTPQHVFQSTSVPLRDEDKTKLMNFYTRPLFFLIEEEPLHIIFIDYFSKLSKQQNLNISLLLLIKLFPLIIPKLS